MPDIRHSPGSLTRSVLNGFQAYFSDVHGRKRRGVTEVDLQVLPDYGDLGFKAPRQGFRARVHHQGALLEFDMKLPREQ